MAEPFATAWAGTAPFTTTPFTTTLPVHGRCATVFGARERAIGHIAALRDGGAEVTVIAPHGCVTVTDLAERGLITWQQRPYEPTDLDTPWLVVAATGVSEVDARIAGEAEDRRLWCLDVAAAAPDPAAETTEVIAPGEVVLVGGGPGDPGLLTVAGREAVRQADVIITDRLAPLAALRNLRPGAEVVDVGKIPRGPTTPQESINRLLVEHAAAGRRVVRFKGGDSLLFGRGGEELQACAAAGIGVRVVPGVSSALAVPAAAGIPVTHRGLNQGFTVLSGHVPPGDPRSTIDYAAVARSGADIVLLMAVATLPAIAAALVDAGLSVQTPAVTIADGTLPGQQVVRGTVATIAADAARAGVGAPAITVIGAVAGFDPQAGPSDR